LLKALVIHAPEKGDMGDLLAIARSSAKAREHGTVDIRILAIRYVEELKVHVAVYSVPDIEKKA
jgi:hypothetical protein